MANLNLDRSKTAVLSMDLFKGMANNPMVQERNTMGNARKVLDAARVAGVPVIHVVIGFREGYPEVSDRNKLFGGMIKKNGLMRMGGEQVEIHDLVKPAPGEVVVNRPRINPFYNSELPSLLKAKDIETVVLMGISTNFVVEAAVRHAADADYRVIVLEDCCASHARAEDHDWTIQNVLSRLVDVASSDDFVESVR